MVLSGAGRALPAVLVPSQKAGKTHPTLLTLKYPSQGSIPGDGDVDLFDYSGFPDCITGPEAEQVPPGCESFTLLYDIFPVKGLFSDSVRTTLLFC